MKNPVNPVKKRIPPSRPKPCDFDRIIEGALSRRSFLSAGVGFCVSALALGSSTSTNAKGATTPHFDFAAVRAGDRDTIVVPDGFNWHVVVRWGDPLWTSGVEFDQHSRGNARSQGLAFGDNNDGMALFLHRGRQILAVNNEYVNRRVFFGNRVSGLPENANDVRKGQAAHGISVVEIDQVRGRWSVVKDSLYNRRITPGTPMEFTGPARGHALLRTIADPTGSRSLGTWSNCGCGVTPWGTYLTCEENFDGYFSNGDMQFVPSLELLRYGVGVRDWGYAWSAVDERFDISIHSNEPNRIGYVVEIDPTDSTSRPRKHTALGRFKHENAELVFAADGRVVVYLGDDERGEYLYRFVSEGRYSADEGASDLLENGNLYVAKFHEGGRGEWLELSPSATGMSRAEICVHTRQAASSVGGTTMDRPEWVAAHPGKAEVYCALTNNKIRGREPNAGGDATPVGGPNPRAGNPYGQIVRWAPDGSDHGSDGFAWDLFVLAGNPSVHGDAYAGSGNVTVRNMFNSPDGVTFDSLGRIWIRTDGSYLNAGHYAGMGNNQMLVGDPGSGEIRRFMVGPRECEISGVTWSADRRTLFVGIQHPGERGGSHFPDGGNSVPRSAVVAIARDDGGRIG